MGKQLYEKVNGEYVPIFPKNLLENIKESEDGRTLAEVLTNFNSIYVPYTNSVEETRNLIPDYMRRKGLSISYNINDDTVTEYYKGRKEDIAEHWSDDNNWEVVPDLDFVRQEAAKLPDGIVTPDKLSPGLQELIKQNNTITNLPDDEDLEERNGVLSFKDKDYNPYIASGKGYKILRKNWVKGKNILIQDMINESNTIYEIGYDYDLDDKEITIPEGCTLKFIGGSFKNGIINGNNTILEGIINICLLKGNFNNDYLKSSSINSDNNYNKLKSLLTCGIKNIYIEEDFEISRFDSTIETNSNIYGNNHNIILNCNIVQNNIMKDFIKCNNISFLQDINIDVKNNSVLKIFNIYNINNIKIKNIQISNIDNTKYISSPSYCNVIQIELIDNAIVDISDIYINNIKTETNDIITDTDGNLSGIYIHIKNNYYYNININNCKFKELHNYKKGNIILEDVSCIYVSQQRPFNTNSVLNINNIYGFNFGKRLIKTDSCNVNINHIDAENYIEDCLTVIGLNNGDSESYNDFPINANISNIKFKGITNYVISSSNENTIINNIYSEITQNFINKKLIGTLFPNTNIKMIANNITLKGAQILFALNNDDINKKSYIFLSDINYDDTMYNHLPYANTLWLHYNADVIINNIKIKTDKINNLCFDNYKQDYILGYNLSINNIEVDYYKEQISDGLFNILKGAQTNPTKKANIKINNGCFNFHKKIRFFMKSYINQNIDLSNIVINFLEPNINTIFAAFDLNNNNISLNNVSLSKVNNEMGSIYVTNKTEELVFIKANNLTDNFKGMMITGNNVYVKGNYIPIINFLSYYTKLTKSEEGYSVKDLKNNNNLVTWNGEKWINNNNKLPVDVKSIGTFSQRPNPILGIEQGFAYYCTDKQTTEGSRNGIMIYYAGDNTWVDALGRVIS